MNYTKVSKRVLLWSLAAFAVALAVSVFSPLKLSDVGVDFLHGPRCADCGRKIEPNHCNVIHGRKFCADCYYRNLNTPPISIKKYVPDDPFTM